MKTIEPTITKAGTPAEAATSIVSAADIGEWLTLSSSMVTAKTALITGLIESAVELVEGYTWLNLLRRQFVAYYDLIYTDFTALLSGDVKLLLNRAPIESLDDITTIEYLASDNTWTEFSRGTEAATGLFDNVTEREERRQWASVYFIESPDFQDRLNAYHVRVTYTAGYTSVPAGVKTAIKMIVANDFTERGDCGCVIDGCGVPCAAKNHLDRYSLRGTVFAGDIPCGW